MQFLHRDPSLCLVADGFVAGASLGTCLTRCLVSLYEGARWWPFTACNVVPGLVKQDLVLERGNQVRSRSSLGNVALLDDRWTRTEVMAEDILSESLMHLEAFLSIFGG